MAMRRQRAAEGGMDWLAERFELQRRVGEGGMAEVWLAKDHGSEPFSRDRRVAIKTLRPLYAEDRSTLARFEREGGEMSRFKHRNIARVYRFMREGDVRFLVMEYIPGGSLAQVLGRRGAPLPPEDAVEIATQVCAALHYAHTRSVLHRDVTPQNVMLDGGYAEGGELRVKLTDFGIAAVLDGTRITSVGEAAGTAAYMAPEVLKGDEGTARSDVYACGVLLYQLLTDRLPFAGRDRSEILARQSVGPPAAPAELNEMVPKALSEATMAALSREPGARYETAENLGLAVRAAWEGEDFRRYLPPRVRVPEEGGTGLTRYLPFTGPPRTGWGLGQTRSWISVLLYFGVVGALLIMFAAVVRTVSAIAELPAWAVATPVVGVFTMWALGRSPLFDPDPILRAESRQRLIETSRSAVKAAVVAALAAYWVFLGYHLIDTVRNAIDRQAQPSHLWLQLGGVALWVVVGLVPLKRLRRSRMRMSRLVLAAAVVAIAWTAGAQYLPHTFGPIARFVWGRPSLAERVVDEGERWSGMLGANDARLGPGDRAELRSQLRHSRKSVLRALRGAPSGYAQRQARRRARHWLDSMRRARVRWRGPRCRRHGVGVSVGGGGAQVSCP